MRSEWVLSNSVFDKVAKCLGENSIIKPQHEEGINQFIKETVETNRLRDEVQAQSERCLQWENLKNFVEGLDDKDFTEFMKDIQGTVRKFQDKTNKTAQKRNKNKETGIFSFQQTSKSKTDLIHAHLKVPEVTLEDPDSWPLIFHRDYVSKNIPVLIKRGTSDISAVQKWNTDYFMKVMSEKNVTVAITPNGFADGLNRINGEEFFVLPQETDMKMKEFLEFLGKKKVTQNIRKPNKLKLKNFRDNHICYIQKQNSNLTEDFRELLDDIDREVIWASKAFNKAPDAVNFWMGDSRAVTSMHKDPYENIYYVIDGYKDFILIPPTDLPYIPYRTYPVKRYNNVTSTNFEVEDVSDVDNIKWIAVDPIQRKESLKLYPEFEKSSYL
ncbi:hypothetical protein NQ317_012354 [Molorchus minor]|uniref:JmjC domain-containing protein n=1 Tax=Molorchus minor TaxID=1323400 RepID=A0ABQ9J142_9CUCU|nr:hypothetical protein NQ317_012354 [Molorchus minor]